MPPPPEDGQDAAIATARTYVKAYNLRPRKPIYYGEGIYTPPGSEGESEGSAEA